MSISTGAPPVRVLALWGSLRAGSSNTAPLRAALALVPSGLTTSTSQPLALPLFDEELETCDAPEALRHLKSVGQAADASPIATPEYRASVTGVLKDAEALVATAIAGAGLAHLPTWLVYQEIRAGSLIQLLGSYEALDEDQGGIYAVRPAARTPSAKLRAFVDLLRARFGNPPYWDRTRESLEDSSIKQASSSPGHLKLVAGTKLHEL